MAKRVVDLDTLITKLGGVLNRDVYIINYTYCIGGDDTNDEKVSDIILELDSDFVNLLKELYPDTQRRYFKKIKESKKDLENNLDLNTNNSIIEELEKKINIMIRLVGDSNPWNRFIINNDDYDSFFDKKEVIKGFINNDDIPDTDISLQLFPKLTEKNIDDFYYKYYKDKYKDIEFIHIVSKLYSDIFMIYNYFKYFTILSVNECS